jgi:hypothetical protein
MDHTARAPVAHTLIVSIATTPPVGLAVVGARAFPGDFFAAVALRLEAAALDLTAPENADASSFTSGVKAGLRMAADLLAEGSAL